MRRLSLRRGTGKGVQDGPTTHYPATDGSP
jgi:hypothetical protein